MCSVAECTEEVYCKLMCSRHYNRFKDYGDTNISRRNLKIDWSQPQYCIGCAKSMVKSREATREPHDAIHGSKGRCESCVMRERKGFSPRYVADTVDDFRQCRLCLDFLPLAEFRKSRGYISGMENSCKLCNKLVYTYHIDKKSYTRMLADQDYSCAVCLTHIDTLDKDLCIDHDHSCCPQSARSCGKCVRGLLCVLCNQAIGMLKDNTDSLRRAISYLEPTQKE